MRVCLLSINKISVFVKSLYTPCLRRDIIDLKKKYSVNFVAGARETLNGYCHRSR